MFRRISLFLLLVVLCAVIWWVGPLVAVGKWWPFSSAWVRGILIALILFAAGGPLLWRICMRISARFRHAPREVSPPPAGGQRLRDAIATLKHVGKSEQRPGWKKLVWHLRRAWLTDRPWFVVVGPDNAGKTSVLSESQQTFLLAEQYGLRAVSSPGSTLEVNWWLGRQAVWIDTPGQWCRPSPEDEKARSGMMRLLRRSRSYPALDGIFLCLNAQVFLHTSLTEYKALVDTLRNRLLDYATDARSDLPVYLLLTHIDELPGGKILLQSMDEHLISKGIGFSLADKNGELSWDLQTLQSRMSQYVLELLHRVSTDEERQQLLALTEALGALAIPLRSLITQVFPPSAAGYGTQLRHLWLGSSVFSFENSQTLKAWNAGRESNPAGGIWQAAFMHAIRERHVLQAGRRQGSGINQIRRALCWVLAVTLLVSGSQWLVNRYQWEKEFVSYLNAAFDETRRLVLEVPASHRPGDNLIAAYEQLGYSSAQLENIATPLANPYIEHRLLNDAVIATWHRHLLKILWPAVESYVVSTLQQDLQTPDSDVYGTLKLYMMLAEPARRDPVAMADWFTARWRLFAPPGYTDNNRQLFGFHLKELFSLKTTPAIERDNTLIRTARVKAADISQQQRVLNRLQENPLLASLPVITLASTAGSEVVLALRRKSNSTVNDIAVPNFFSRESFKEVVLPNLEEMSRAVLDEEAWVMSNAEESGASGPLTSVKRLMEETRKLYFIEYASHWTTFINDVRARSIQGMDDAAQLARQLAEPGSPLANLVRSVTRETSLSGRDEGSDTGWIDNQRFKFEKQKRIVLDEISGERTRFHVTPEAGLEDRFQALRRLGLEPANNRAGNDSLMRTFSNLYNQLAALSVRLQSGETLAQGNALSALKIDAARQPDPVRSVMLDLISLGESQTVEKRRQVLYRNTASMAAGECRNVLSNRYPFVRTARNEVGIDDFTRLFGPDGTLQTFFSQNLASLVDVNQRPWRAREKGMVPDSTLRAFESAARIRESWFRQNDKPGFNFLISPVVLSNNIAEAVLDVDGQLLHYSHGQSQPVRMQWPGPKGGSYIRITFRTSGGAIQTAVFEGPWAILRFYDAASVSVRGQDTRELTMMLGGVPGSYSINVRALQQNFPLWSKNLRNFTCP